MSDFHEEPRGDEPDVMVGCLMTGVVALGLGLVVLLMVI